MATVPLGGYVCPKDLWALEERGNKVVDEIQVIFEEQWNIGPILLS
jgi:hypothetical protein